MRHSVTRPPPHCAPMLSSAGSQRVTFINPTASVNGLPIDWCANFGSACGQVRQRRAGGGEVLLSD